MDEEFLDLLTEATANKMKKYIAEFAKRHIDFEQAENTVFEFASQNKRINIEKRRLEHFFGDNVDMLFKYGPYMDIINYQTSMLKFDSSLVNSMKQELALLDLSVGLPPLLLTTLPALMQTYERKESEEEGSNYLWR